MKILLLFVFIGGIGATSLRKVGCENNPCDHTCIDTADSYYCTCFENWVLQPDSHSCLQLAQQDYDAAYLGCYDDTESFRDLKHLIWTRTVDCNVPQCMHDCRGRGFRFAGLQNGNQCWCGNSYQRAYNATGICNMPCPGSSSQMCGGVLSNSIYKVTRDSKYAGCYNEDAGSPDLPTVLWGPTDGRSVDQCNLECSKQGYLYSGIFNGGQCACGNDYGKHGLAGEEYCMVRCFNGWASQNCGGNSSNAIYRVERGRDFTYAIDKMVQEGKRATIPASEMYLYPHQIGMYGKRIVLYASDTVNNIYDDVTCTNGECYNLCGEIHVPDGFDRYREDVVVRKFYLKLSELPNFIQFPDVAEAVYVYAQTVYIDTSVTFDFALYIRARQIIINYAVSPGITFNHEGRELNINVSQAIYTGAPSDLTFQKQSMLCARMMVSSTNDDNNRIGWNIIDDMVRDHAYTTEQKHFLDSVRATRSELTSIGRNDVHFAPFYTQLYYVNKLDLYYREITIYNTAYKELLESAEDCIQYKERAGTLIRIWTDTIVAEAAILLQYAEDNLAISEATYEQIYTEYNESRVELEAAGEVFKQGLEDWKKEQVRKAMFGFIGSAIKLAFGIFPCGAAGVVGDIKDSVDGVIVGLQYLEVTMENLAKTMEELEAFLNITDYIIETKDYARYMDNVEAVAGLNAMIPEWANYKYQVDVIFREDEFRVIDGALGFSFALFDLCNWGEALTRSMTEYALSIRQYVMYDAIYENRVEMQQRYQEYFEQVGAECEEKEKMTIAFAEQQYDVSLELNDNLILFCQATYYENMEWCRNASRPNFAYSVEALLSSIQSAHADAMNFKRESPGAIDFEIIDEETAWDNCTDSKECPIKMFRETGMLYYELPTDHRRFLGLSLYMVEEIRIFLPGATSKNGTQDLRLQVSASGPFINRLYEEEATFISRALSSMAFQYAMDDCNIELYCQLYQPDGAMIKHSTPFTTWLIQLDPSWTHVDISGVERIEMVLMGHFLNQYEDANVPRPALPERVCEARQ